MTALSKLARLGITRGRSGTWLLSFLMVTLLCASCNMPSPSPSVAAASSFALRLDNVDGQPVEMLVNGKVAATAVCYLLSSNEPVPVLTPGPDLPLPWLVEVRLADGSSLGTWHELGDSGARMLVVRGRQVTEVPDGAQVGQPPVGTCPP